MTTSARDGAYLETDPIRNALTQARAAKKWYDWYARLRILYLPARGGGPWGMGGGRGVAEWSWLHQESESRALVRCTGRHAKQPGARLRNCLECQHRAGDWAQARKLRTPPWNRALAWSGRLNEYLTPLNLLSVHLSVLRPSSVYPPFVLCPSSVCQFTSWARRLVLPRFLGPIFCPHFGSGSLLCGQTWLVEKSNTEACTDGLVYHKQREKTITA